ncbi:MAG: response regulator [Methanomicrobiales archaeon]|nr:response regulator [Methanomicrobiales archaeon]
MSPKVMVIDDDLPTLEVMKLLLPRLGWDPIMVSNAVEALDLLEKEKPRLILLDIMMSPLNGWEFLKKLREKPEMRDIPVLLFTAKHIWPEEFSLYAEGVVGVLEKPVLPSDLRRVLEQFA